MYDEFNIFILLTERNYEPRESIGNRLLVNWNSIGEDNHKNMARSDLRGKGLPGRLRKQAT